jgi:DNA-binding response OmpR family regulator
MLPSAATIVMIEDDEGHGRLIEKNIRRAGINNEILSFNTGQSGMSYVLANANRPAKAILLLLDLNLPDISGIDILAELKKRRETSRIPIIILTTTDDREEISRCYDLGCNVYLTKPVAFDSFSQAVRQLGLFLTLMQVPEPAK